MVLEVKKWLDWWYDAASNCDTPHDASVFAKKGDNKNNDVNELFFDAGSSKQCSYKRSRQDEKLLLDVRSDEEYRQRHLMNTFRSNIPDDSCQQRLTVVHIPLTELKDRRFELPPRRSPFAILLSIDDKRNDSTHKNSTELQLWLQDILSGHGDTVLYPHSSNNGASSETRRRLTQSWNVTALLNANDMELWRSAGQCGVSVVMAGLEGLNETNPYQIHLPQPRLWSPDPMVEDILLPLLRQTIQSNSNGFIDIWDFGSGVGRDVCFLAEELVYWSSTLLSSTPDRRFRFRVVGWDQRYRDNHSNDTVDFWKRRQVDAVAECQCVDFGRVSTVTKLFEALPLPSSDDQRCPIAYCIYAVRYWNKSLFQSLIQAGCDGILPSGTIVAISHFGKSSIDSTWDFPHPKEQHVLHRFELRDMFTIHDQQSPVVCGSSWKILLDQVVLDSDHGRPIIQFVAQLVE